MKNITPIILILLAIGIFFVLIDPKYKEVQVLQAEISENNKTLALAAQLASKRTELRQKFNMISAEEKSMLEKLLPDTVDNVRLIIYINNIADQLGIVIRDINISTDEEIAATSRSASVRTQSQFEGMSESDMVQYVDRANVGAISFSFSVSARYEVFLEFLDQLEESLRIVDIRNIEITRGTDAGGLYDYKVTLETYWLK